MRQVNLGLLLAKRAKVRQHNAGLGIVEVGAELRAHCGSHRTHEHGGVGAVPVILVTEK